MKQSRLIQKTYAREPYQAGILHIGVGAFHRAHQAVFVDDLLALEPSSH